MTDDTCDNTSVGMLVWHDDKLLLIERKKPPFGFAAPAGHVDADATYENAALRELTEEVGLRGTALELVLEQETNNPCRRGGTWHHWKVYSTQVSGTVQPSQSETKRAGWYSRQQLRQLAERTQAYLDGQIDETAWEQEPGLELVWFAHLRQLAII